jgi:phosphate transport system substrate-binding protein
MKIKTIILLVALTAIMGCSDKDQDSKRSLPTMGKLLIGIDESLRPVTDAEIETFSVFYPDAEITPLYLPEKQVVEKLLNNEIQTGIICRDLYEDEINHIKSYQHSPTTFKLAEDAIVAVVNNANPLNTISCNDIKKILSGKTTDWEQLDAAFKSPVMLVITGSSSINRYFSSLNDPLTPISAYALGTTTEVIDYVKNNPSAIGLLGGSWFYQKGNKYSEVKLLSYTKDNSETGDPDQGLFREVYAVTHEPFTGLGTGFISFMGNQKGQMILEKAGMTPYQPISREIQIINHIPPD